MRSPAGLVQARARGSATPTRRAFWKPGKELHARAEMPVMNARSPEHEFERFDACVASTRWGGYTVGLEEPENTMDETDSRYVRRVEPI